jgi:hypothetical protein
MNKLERTLDEIRSGSVLLTCGKHRYVAARKTKNGGLVALPPNPDGPSRGCKFCWECYYVTDLCLTLPGRRQERLEELDEVIHHLVEFVAKGKFDFVPDINPTIKYHRDAADDITGEDRHVIITDSEEVN